jgi:hypothetical protein
MAGFHPLCDSAAIMILSEQHPRVILFRSPEPILSPMLHLERYGIVPKVVFPAGIDRRDSIPSMHCATSSVLRCMRSCGGGIPNGLFCALPGFSIHTRLTGIG